MQRFMRRPKRELLELANTFFYPAAVEEPDWGLAALLICGLGVLLLLGKIRGPCDSTKSTAPASRGPLKNGFQRRA
jgi:hypothetical protein